MQFRASEEVGAALAAGGPVVALESSLIAHGFRSPDNLAVGRTLEAAVRDEGAVPATVGVIAGEIRVGLDASEMARIAERDVEKCSARDLSFVCAMGRDGATTVAATVRIAAAAGIAVFATGGIGGVHRGASVSYDISADLIELSRANVAVVCAGAKTLLDLKATLEVLETQGVPVIGYACDEFPAFYTAESGLPLNQRVASVAVLARVVARHRALALPGGLVICNPPPREVSLAAPELEALVAAALFQAEAQNVSGAALTPFVLDQLDGLSGGRTRTCNKALAESNARLAARLTVVLADEV